MAMEGSDVELFFSSWFMFYFVALMIFYTLMARVQPWLYAKFYYGYMSAIVKSYYSYMPSLIMDVCVCFQATIERVLAFIFAGYSLLLYACFCYQHVHASASIIWNLNLNLKLNFYLFATAAVVGVL